MRVGILTDFPSPSVQSGPALHTRFLEQGLLRRGHQVTLMGPDTSQLASTNGTPTHLYKAFSYPTHPNVKLAMPLDLKKLYARPPQLDIIHGQTNSHMARYASWLRKMYQVGVLHTQTIHLPTHSHFLMSDGLWSRPVVQDFLRSWALSIEHTFAEIYNESDCLIVQSRFLVDYWRERGVTVPIEVVGRPINPKIFSKQPGADPFPANYKMGKRLLCVCRHDREKNLHELVRIFATRIAPSDPKVTLTIVGDGHDHANLMEYAASMPAADRIHFPGEAKHEALVDWYAHADLFVYTSLSETFGNVVNEALWSGLPVVALDDRMGVAHQVADGVNGLLIEPDRVDTADAFAAGVLTVLGDRQMRRAMGSEAANLSRRTSHPDVVLARFERIYADARRHAREHVPVPLSQQSRLARMKSFSSHIWSWARWNGTLLSIGHLATRLGMTRTGGASQHEAAVLQAKQQGVQLHHAESHAAA